MCFYTFVTFAVGYVVELARDDPVWKTLRCVPEYLWLVQYLH